MRNGYCMPKARGSIAALSERLINPELGAAARAQLQVGIHWDTEVKSKSHRVCQAPRRFQF